MKCSRNVLIVVTITIILLSSTTFGFGGDVIKLGKSRKNSIIPGQRRGDIGDDEPSFSDGSRIGDVGEMEEPSFESKPSYSNNIKAYGAPGVMWYHYNFHSPHNHHYERYHPNYNNNYDIISTTVNHDNKNHQYDGGDGYHHHHDDNNGSDGHDNNHDHQHDGHYNSVQNINDVKTHGNDPCDVDERYCGHYHYEEESITSQNRKPVKQKLTNNKIIYQQTSKPNKFQRKNNTKPRPSSLSHTKNKVTTTNHKLLIVQQTKPKKRPSNNSDGQKVVSDVGARVGGVGPNNLMRFIEDDVAQFYAQAGITLGNSGHGHASLDEDDNFLLPPLDDDDDGNIVRGITYPAYSDEDEQIVPEFSNNSGEIVTADEKLNNSRKAILHRGSTKKMQTTTTANSVPVRNGKSGFARLREKFSRRPNSIKDIISGRPMMNKS